MAASALICGGVIVDTSGIVCAVAFSGADFTSRSGSGAGRHRGAEAANTANAFSLTNSACRKPHWSGKDLPLSTANLFTAVQPGEAFFGLQHSNPVETDVAYGNQPVTAKLTLLQQTPQPSARRRIRWSASASAALTCLAAASRSIPMAVKVGASSVSAGTRPAPTTWSPGERATR